MEPSTSWKEQIDADEATRFEGYAQQIAGMQRDQSKKFGEGRALHRKGILGLGARFEVLGDLPAHARHGLFAQPSVHEALVRFSNALPMVVADRKPDIRGFAVKVLGVEGPGALGGPTHSQDFVMINRTSFGFAKPDLFAGLVTAVPRGPLAVVGFFIRELGFFGGLGMLRKLARSQAQKFTGFATEKFSTAAPIACGPYAMKLRISPRTTTPLSPSAADWKSDFEGHLASGPVEFDVQLQFFVDEKLTPIEDGSVDWPESEAPFITVGKLTLLAPEDVEKSTFDPWLALVDHRPLGAVMRARKPAYFASQKGRGVA